MPRRQTRNIFIDGRNFSWGEIDEIHITQTTTASSAQLIPAIRARRRLELVVTTISDAWYVAYDGEDVTDRFITGPPGEPGGSGKAVGMATNRKAVMIVCGVDRDVNTAMFDWLRAVGLQPRVGAARHCDGRREPVHRRRGRASLRERAGSCCRLHSRRARPFAPCARGCLICSELAPYQPSLLLLTRPDHGGSGAASDDAHRRRRRTTVPGRPGASTTMPVTVAAQRRTLLRLTMQSAQMLTRRL